MAKKTRGMATRAIHTGQAPDPTTGALNTPIYQSTIFAFSSAEEGAAIFCGEKEGYYYTRCGNPTIATLETAVAALEEGAAALATASGMAAIATTALTLLRSGDHMVSVDAIYSGTFAFFTRELPKSGIEVTLVDGSDISAVTQALRPNTKAIYIETPGNPTLKLADIAALAKLGKNKGLTTIIDNTFATPCGQQPLKMGIDIVVHSATKYICGHGDAIGGIIIGNEDFIQRASNEVLETFGGVISPFNSWLLLRGLSTLPLRFAQHSSNALEVAKFLEGHPAIEWVSYPGLPSHPQHELAKKQMSQYGGMVCFEVKGGLVAGHKLMNALRLCTLAVSLGDTKSLISHPASMTHSGLPRDKRIAAGITDGLVRLSVGLEDVTDIIADLEQGLAQI